MGWLDNVNWGNVGQGAAGGAGAGAVFGPLGAGIGALGGALLGGFQQKPKTASEMGINQFDAMAEARKFMPSDAELNTQRNAFNTSNNQNIDEYAKQLIASGMNPQQAYTVAQNKMSSNVNRFESSQQQAQAQQQKQLGLSLMPYQMQREEDILNYDLQAQNQMSPLQQGMGIGAMGGMLLSDVDKGWAKYGNMFNNYRNNNTTPNP